MGFLMFFFFAIAIAGFVFWIRMLIECATREPDTGNDKLIWILIIVLAGWLGALIYYFVRRPRRMADIGW
jgi:nitrate reductase gamma subunit